MMHPPLFSASIRIGSSFCFGLFLFFSYSYAAGAAVIPKTVTFTNGDFTRTITEPTLTNWFDLKTTSALDYRKKNEIADPHYCGTDAIYCFLSLSRQTRTHVAIVLSREINEQAIESFLSDFSKEVDQEPVNAVFGVNADGKVIIKTAEKFGVKLDEEVSLETILQALSTDDALNIRITLKGVVARPKIIGSDLERLGLKELVGEGRSNFKGSPKNRVWNITRAVKQYDGVLIEPGAEFSFVDYLGEVDGEHGYLPELVIKNNKTEPEFGGGICQVSSTVFRAAIFSGLKITERRNHSYAVQYYKPIGLDATIYIPRPDLKFENNTPGYILMQPVIDGDNLTFQFYGTKDGRKVTVDGPHVLEKNPDGSMKTVFTQMVTNNQDVSFIKDSFWSNYKSPALFPHPGDEKVYTSKPKGWSNKEWDRYRRGR